MPIWTIPDEAGSSVDVISSARAHLRQRMTVTWMAGRCVESMLCRTGDLDEVDERSESDVEYDDDDESELEYGALVR